MATHVGFRPGSNIVAEREASHCQFPARECRGQPLSPIKGSLDEGKDGRGGKQVGMRGGREEKKIEEGWGLKEEMDK